MILNQFILPKCFIFHQVSHVPCLAAGVNAGVSLRNWLEAEAEAGSLLVTGVQTQQIPMALMPQNILELLRLGCCKEM